MRAGHRALHHLGAAFAPFAGRDELIGVGGEERFDGAGILAVAGVHVLLDERADGGFVARGASWTLREQRGGKRQSGNAGDLHA